jgi:hypothetical protein
MPKWWYRLREVVWVAVVSFALAVGSVVIALLGASLETVLALGASSIALAVLAQRS